MHVCIYVFIHDYTIIPSDLPVPDTFNCCIYPLIPTVRSSNPLQQLHQPSCHLRANTSKPSHRFHPPSYPHRVIYSQTQQPWSPPYCPQNINSCKPSNHYIHRPPLTQLTPANHHSHYIYRPALTQLTPAAIIIITSTVLPLQCYIQPTWTTITSTLLPSKN